MKILVLSDSHGGPHFMRYAVNAVKPNAIIHLGDRYDDGASLAEEFPHILVHQVPGNCDAGFLSGLQPETLCYPVCGVKLYMTHGHNHDVKRTLFPLRADARKACAAAALFGHTHNAYCEREEDGLWLLNPGTCRNFAGTVGLIEVNDHQIMACRILRQSDLEEML